MTPTEHEMTVADLRYGLGMVCQHVARTNETVVVTRYGKGIVAVVPLWEWRFFKELEADLLAGRKRILDLTEDLEIEWDIAGTVAGEPVSDSPDAGRRSPRDTTNTTAENTDGNEEGTEDPGEESHPEDGGEG